MRSSETSPANAPPQSSTRQPRSGARRSRCSSSTSNAFSASDDSDYAAHVAFKTNLPSQPPPRTSGNWQSSSHLHQSQDEKPGWKRSHPSNESRSSQPRSKSDGFFNGISSNPTFAAPWQTA